MSRVRNASSSNVHAWQALFAQDIIQDSHLGRSLPYFRHSPGHRIVELSFFSLSTECFRKAWKFPGHVDSDYVMVAATTAGRAGGVFSESEGHGNTRTSESTLSSCMSKTCLSQDPKHMGKLEVTQLQSNCTLQGVKRHAHTIWTCIKARMQTANIQENNASRYVWMNQYMDSGKCMEIPDAEHVYVTAYIHLHTCINA